MKRSHVSQFDVNWNHTSTKEASLNPTDTLARHFHCESLACSSESYDSKRQRLSVLKLHVDSDESAIDEERLEADVKRRRDEAFLQRADVLQSLNRPRRPPAAAAAQPGLGDATLPIESPMSKLRATTSPTSTGATFSTLNNELTGSRSPSSSSSPSPSSEPRRRRRRVATRKHAERSELCVKRDTAEIARLLAAQQSFVDLYRQTQCNSCSSTLAPPAVRNTEPTHVYHHDASFRSEQLLGCNSSNHTNNNNNNGASIVGGSPWHSQPAFLANCAAQTLLHRHALQRPDPNCLPKRVLANLVAYWLSLKYEQATIGQSTSAAALALNDLCMPPSSTFVPAYLRNGAFLKQTLSDICWSSGTKAIDRVGAVQISENIGAYSSPAHLQATLQQFINTIGAAAIQFYLENNTNWSELAQRYRCLLSARTGSIAEMLRTMSTTACV